MAPTLCYPLNVAIGAQLQDPTKMGHPFNIRFSDRSQKAGIPKRELSGPGIYTVSFNCEVIYLGKYQPYQRGNILNDRWIRHIEALTLRGSRVGFNGTSNALAKLNRLLRDVRSGELAAGLRDACPERFRDTGVVTTPSKLRFADQHWERFSKSTPQEIFDGFEFSLMHLEGVSSSEEAKALVTNVENRLLERFSPLCNCDRVGSRDQQRYTSSDILNCLTTSGLLPGRLSLRSALVLNADARLST